MSKHAKSREPLRPFDEAMGLQFPLISVLVSNFNHGHYIEQSLQGILRQDYPNFEVIVTDDGSTDGSQAIIRAVAARDPRVNAQFFSTNRGAMEATRNNMSRAKGTLVYGAAADDFIVSEKFFSMAIESLRSEQTAAGFFGVAGLYSADKNKLIGSKGSSPWRGLIKGQKALRAFLCGELFVPGNSSIWRRDAMETVDGFAYDLGPQVDYWMNHALPILHGVAFSPTPVTCQRVYACASNFGSKGTLWEVARRFEAVETRLREIAEPYDGWDRDWAAWRAGIMKDAILKSLGGPG